MNRTELAAQIRVALASHAMWKHHLEHAIRTGRAARPADELRREDRCAFGTWLLGLAPLRAAPQFTPVRDLHARFHEEAARVLELATTGRAEAAAQAMSERGSFERASRDLKEALERWAEAG